MEQNYLMHFGVKGMRWGHHTYAQPQTSLGQAKANYKIAKQNYNKSFNKAYSFSSRHFISQNFGKNKEKSNALWNDAQNKAKTLNTAKSNYQKEKQSNKENNKVNTDRRNKAIKVAAVAAGTALAAYGGYKAAKFIKSKDAQMLTERSEKKVKEILNERGARDRVIANYRRSNPVGSKNYNDWDKLADQNWETYTSKALSVRKNTEDTINNRKLRDAAKNVGSYYGQRAKAKIKTKFKR